MMMHTSDHVDIVGQQGQDDVEGTANEMNPPPTSNETEDNLPPLSSCLDGWEFWWKFAKFPVASVMINAILIYTSVVQYDEHGKNSYRFNKQDNWMDPALEAMKHFSLVLGFLLLFDTVVLYRGALNIEKQVDALRLQESNDNVVASTASSSLTHVHAKVSKIVDQFLCQGHAVRLPEVSFLVNILFLLTGLSVAATAVSFSMYGLLHTSKASSKCVFQTPPGSQAMPQALHGWAFPSREIMDGPQELSGTHVHMVDGTTYFAGLHFGTPTQRELGNAGSQPILLPEGPDGTLRSSRQLVSSSQAVAYAISTTDRYYRGSADSLVPILLAAGPDGTLRSYPQFVKPAAFASIAGRNDEASEGFCCSYSNTSTTTDSFRWTASVLCIGGGGVESRGKDVRTKSIPAEDNSQYARNPMEMQDVSLRAHDGILWVRLQFYRFQPEYAMYFEIYSLNPQTMTLTSIANTTVVQGRSFHDGSPCLRWISPLPYLVAAPILFLVAYWLLKCRDIPAGTTFLCLGAAACLGYADAEAWPGLLAMVSVGATVSLFTSLPPWLSRDMILWGLYTSLAVATLSDLNCWWGCGDLSIGMLAVGIGLVLNHPVLQIMGWLGMVLTPFVAAQSIMNGMQEFVIVPVVLVISSGLLSMGSYIQKHFQKYRTYLVVYTRHLWRIFLLSAEMAPNNETLSGQGRRGAATSDTVMMQGLVSTRDD